MEQKIGRTAFNGELAILMDVDRQTLDRIGTSLRKAGMVSVGGRGPNVPHITPEDAKNILLGLLGTDNASRAADAVKVLTELKSPVGEMAGDAIVKLLIDPSFRKDFSAIHVTRNYPLVELYWGYEEYPDGLEGEFGPQREEIYGIKDGCPGMLVKAILAGNILHTIMESAANFVFGQQSAAAEAQKRAKENRAKGLAMSYSEGEYQKWAKERQRQGLSYSEDDYQAMILAEMKAKREKAGIK
jgi:hypothetical protein